MFNGKVWDRFLAPGGGIPPFSGLNKNVFYVILNFPLLLSRLWWDKNLPLFLKP